MAIFQEHRAVSIKKARKVVNKAGFDYLGAEGVVTGHLEWSGKPGESDLLLKDPKAEMILRLTVSDTESSYNKLVDEYRQGKLGDTVQVRGSVLESRKANKQVKEQESQFSLAVTDWSKEKSAELPPLVPEKSKRKDETAQDSGDGWF